MHCETERVADTAGRTPQWQAARALLLQARALLEEVEPGGATALLRVLAAMDG